MRTIQAFAGPVFPDLRSSVPRHRIEIASPRGALDCIPRGRTLLRCSRRNGYVRLNAIDGCLQIRTRALPRRNAPKTKPRELSAEAASIAARQRCARTDATR